MFSSAARLSGLAFMRSLIRLWQALLLALGRLLPKRCYLPLKCHYLALKRNLPHLLLIDLLSQCVD